MILSNLNIPKSLKRNSKSQNVPICEMPYVWMPHRTHLSIVPANEDAQESRRIEYQRINGSCWHIQYPWYHQLLLQDAAHDITSIQRLPTRRLIVWLISDLFLFFIKSTWSKSVARSLVLPQPTKKYNATTLYDMYVFELIVCIWTHCMYLNSLYVFTRRHSYRHHLQWPIPLIYW